MTSVKKINAIISRFENQYFYNELVGSYCIDTQKKLILVDLPTYSKHLESFFVSFKKPIVAILSHGACGISDGIIWQQKVGLKIYLHKADKDNQWIRIKPDVLFDIPPIFAPNLEVIFTPGHTPGSICVYETDTRTMFTGDTIGGLPNGEINDFFSEDGIFYGDLHERFLSCTKLLSYDFNTILPFHYNMILQGVKESLKQFIMNHKTV
ncbi:MBL fold metallo-hydrolase [Candidatus Gottesmanbacteria bacterium]|nr:MBL fold metallo-hydrolase [Candidatus Gottesmanbacteria bacterium]